jgi:hypothetical protein
MTIGELTATERDQVKRSVMALPPLSEEQIAGICEVIIAARGRWQRNDQR